MGAAKAASQGGCARAVSDALVFRGRAAWGPGRAAHRRQRLGLQVPAGVFPAGERPERGDAAATCGESFLGCAASALQREERKAEPGPGAVPERDTYLHRGTEEPAHRPECR